MSVRWRGGSFDSYPSSFPSEVTIATWDGASHTVRLEHQRGGPASPLSTAELTEKFRRNAEPILDASQIADALEALLHLEEYPTLDLAVNPLAGRTPIPPVAV